MTASSDRTRIRKNCTDSIYPLVYMNDIELHAGAATHGLHPGINIAWYAK